MNAARPRGFIALMSAIIISAVLLLVVTTSSFTGFYTRLNVLDTELKARSFAAADACASVALFELAQNLNPSDVVLSLNNLDECRVGAVTGTAQKTFRVQATSSNSAVTNLQIVVDTSDFSIVSWQEISTF